MTQFEVGKTYQTRSFCDHNCIISASIVRRTEKTVTAKVDGKVKTFRPYIYDNAEVIRPWGNHSMSPIMNATDTKELRRDWERQGVPAFAVQS